MEICRLEHIHKDYRMGEVVTPLKDICLSVNEGDFIAVEGPSGIGKSTLINNLCGKAKTITGNKPGVTKGKQWIKLNKNLELLDTPGILWPKFEDQQIGLRLAMAGSINDEILNIAELAVELIKFLVKEYPGTIMDRYGVSEDMKELDLLEQIGIKRGCLKKGNTIDIDKAADIIVDEFRAGKLGRISLERP